MKSKQILWLLLLIPAMALMGCEGDAGPAGLAGTDGTDGADGSDGADGADGADGVDGTNGSSPGVCFECHSDSDFLQVGLEYAQSHHKDGLYVGYAGGRESCARCHSKQGFVQYAVNGEVVGDVDDPAAIDCSTCHMVHPDSFGLRLTGPVPWIADEDYGGTSVDFGDNSNLCAQCHQSRRAEPNISDPGDTFEITSTHYGPHHGAMANVLAGALFAEIPGSMTYNGESPHVGLGVTCVSCHMETYTDGAGGHTWWPNLANCTTCHPSATDFDIGGVQSDTQVLLDQLQALLLDQGVIEWVEEDMAYEPVLGTYQMAQAQAFFNWIGLTEDRSLGVHNAPYVEALLTNSIEAITPVP